MKSFIIIAFLAFFNSLVLAQDTTMKQAHELPLSGGGILNWEKINNATDSYFTALNWPIQDTIWATTGKVAIRSTDAGLTWATVSGSPGGRLLFATGKNGTCVGGNPSYVTVDGGQNWIPYSTDSLTNVAYACRIGKTDTLIAGDTRSPYIFRSTNGGKKWSSFTWQKKDYPIVGMGTITFAPDNKTGYIFGDMITGFPNFDSVAALCIKTTDAGNTWKEIYSGIKNNIFCAFAITSSIIIAGDDRSNVYRSEDGGNSWKKLQTTIQGDYALHAIDFLGSIGLIVGEENHQGNAAVILQSNDSGKTWNNVPNNLTSGLSSVKFSPFQTEIPLAVASGGGGNVIRTNGYSSVALETTNKIDLAVQVFPNPNSQIENLSYSLQSPQLVTLTIFDELGRLVLLPLQNISQSGDQLISIQTGSLANGTYHFLISTEAYYATGSFVVLK